jgi:hypothetical protein
VRANTQQKGGMPEWGFNVRRKAQGRWERPSERRVDMRLGKEIVLRPLVEMAGALYVEVYPSS